MSYTGTPEQRALVQEAMQKLHKERDVPDSEAADSLKRWIATDTSSVWPEITVRTYNRYRLKGVKGGRRGELIYNFLSRGPDRFRMISTALSGGRAFNDQQKFVNSMMTNFVSGDGGYEYHQLESMTYTYEFFRRSWRVDDGKHFIRSLLRIEKDEGVFHLTEAQKFETAGTVIEEVDTGWIFPYSTNFIAQTNSTSSTKFYVFHDLFPAPAQDQAVMEMKGNLIAVSGKGPHPSFRFFARRLLAGAVDLGHYHVDEFEDDNDMNEILDYVMKKN